MVELHQQRLVLLPQYFATRMLLDDCFKASGAEPIVVAEMTTIAPMLGLVSAHADRRDRRDRTRYRPR